jgi:DNA-binding MarR family transcriptional regulator
MTGSRTVDVVADEMRRLWSLILREGGRLGDPPDRRMTNTQSLALSTLVSEGPLRLWALAERMATTDATATRTVDALEAEGLVQRQAVEGDRRGVLVGATPRGKQVAAERVKRMHIVVERLLAGTSELQLKRIAGFLRELNDELTLDNEQSRRAAAE